MPSVDTVLLGGMTWLLSTVAHFVLPPFSTYFVRANKLQKSPKNQDLLRYTYCIFGSFCSCNRNQHDKYYKKDPITGNLLLDFHWMLKALTGNIEPNQVQGIRKGDLALARSTSPHITFPVYYPHPPKSTTSPTHSRKIGKDKILISSNEYILAHSFREYTHQPAHLHFSTIFYRHITAILGSSSFYGEYTREYITIK